MRRTPRPSLVAVALAPYGLRVLGTGAVRRGAAVSVGRGRGADAGRVRGVDGGYDKDSTGGGDHTGVEDGRDDGAGPLRVPTARSLAPELGPLPGEKGRDPAPHVT